MLFKVSFELSIRAVIIQRESSCLFLHQIIVMFLISGMIWQAEYKTGQFALYNDYEHFLLW